MTTWPTLSKLPDQSTWNEEREDPSISVDMEGGYSISRPRFTRTPRWTFRFNYMDLSNTDKAAWDAFYETVYGGSDAFTFTHPFNGNSYTMRFITKTAGRPAQLKYANFHKMADGTPDHRWNITDIEIQEI
jgi:hypothetical protein